MIATTPILPDVPDTRQAWIKARAEGMDKSLAARIGRFIGTALLRILTFRLWLIPLSVIKQYKDRHSYSLFRNTNGQQIIIDGKIQNVAAANRVIVPTRIHKFKFLYSRDGLSVEDKLTEQDRHALLILNEKSIQDNVHECSNKLSNYLKKHVGVLKRKSFIITINNLLKTYSNSKDYPIPKIKFKSFNDLLTFFKSDSHYIVKLSIIWLTFAASNGDQTDRDINNIYEQRIKPQKDYIDRFADKMTAIANAELDVPPRFGNTAAIQDCDLFSRDRFIHFIRSIDYISINPQTKNVKLKKYLDGLKPYISGASGMANSFCKVLNHLHIHPYSSEGGPLCHAMAAFIVGSGMHSYEEVFYSFNEYAKIRPLPYLDNAAT
ncbi:MAG: hypothetical protein WCF19_07590 [Chlamydiales bacterium]